MEQAAQKKRKTFTELLRVRFKGILDPVADFLNSLGLSPNTVTLLGLAGNTGGAILIALGQITWGGILILLMGPIDALDGTMARLRGQPTKYGAFLDSVTDRYSELVIYAGLLVYFLRIGNYPACFFVYLAAAGSVLVSYTKARAEGLGFDCNVGLLTRVERFLILAPALVLNYPQYGVWIIAALANLTALQRIFHIRSQAQKRAQIETQPVDHETK